MSGSWQAHWEKVSRALGDLSEAVHCGDLALARRALEQGVNLDAPVTVKRHSHLMIACMRCHPQVALFLIDSGARLDTVDRDQGMSALHWACNRGLADVAIELIDRGQDWEKRDKNGRTPIMHLINSLQKEALVKVFAHLGLTINSKHLGRSFRQLFAHNEMAKGLIAEMEQELKSASVSAMMASSFSDSLMQSGASKKKTSLSL